jgi:hypothetical protein
VFFDQHPMIEEEDQCFTCEYFCKGVACPLLEALAVGVCHLSMEQVIVKNCQFYVPFERKLKLI